jgi:hypothetical protein
VSTTQAIFSQNPDGTVPEGRKQLLEDRLEEDERNTEELTTRQDTVEQEMSEANRKVSSFDEKYHNITEELYSTIRSLQVGGVALSNQFGNREDIGISQKTLTKSLGRIWEELGTITGKTYMDYTLTVQPTQIWAEGPKRVTVIADCSDAISDFDNIRVYVNGVLKAESHDITRYQTTVEITEDSIIRVDGVIMGKTITKSQEVKKAIPFFMGSGMNYQEVMVPENLKELIGTLEGDYDLTVKNNGDYMFIIIPVSHKDEFRRADMNGLGIKIEIPMASATYDDYVVYKSLNTYKAGTYNIDIDINS